ncbi:hypothetical protein L0244_38800, partial [bacterium]|nr:hypothetical protein [bacterium]
MRQITFLFGLFFLFIIGLAVSIQTVSAQDPLKAGTILQRTELANPKGMEAILVLREVPAGKESGKHTQSNTEIVYILE